MASRVCPQCMGVVPAGKVAAFSDGVECPHCHARLEVANGSRELSAALGLLAGWLVWRLTQNSGGILGAVLPELYAVLAFGIVSPLALMLTGALHLAPAAPPADAVTAASHGHSGHH